VIVKTLLALLYGIGFVFTTLILRVSASRRQLKPNIESIGVGAVTNFFDALGIGSFATTTAYIKLRKLVPDSFIPATLNVGHALPTIAQALIFIKLVKVDPPLLVACIVAAVAGSLVGAPIVQRTPVRVVQGFVGVALLIAAALYAAANLDWMPIGGDALALSGSWFVVAIVAHFVLGVLMMFGIGLYAPSLVTLSLLGLSPAAAFPIMMGACAFLMPVSALGFVRSERIDLGVILGIAIGGIPAVLLAAFVVKSLPLVWLRWGVVVVVLYAAIMLLRSAMRPVAAVEATAPVQGSA
jgi:Sulfite exporter TauE/SafE.